MLYTVKIYDCHFILGRHFAEYEPIEQTKQMICNVLLKLPILQLMYLQILAW